jgi:hypothetical protein
VGNFLLAFSCARAMFERNGSFLFFPDANLSQPLEGG